MLTKIKLKLSLNLPVDTILSKFTSGHYFIESCPDVNVQEQLLLTTSLLQQKQERENEFVVTSINSKIISNELALNRQDRTKEPETGNYKI